MVMVVLAMALWAFSSGVDVSDRPGLPDMGILTHLYYGVGLFVLGGMDLGTPTGGTLFARSVLWVAYFLAPAITTGAVIEGLLRVIGSRWLERIGLRNHVVVVGMGRVGMSFVEALREREPTKIIVIVDRDLGRANIEQARRRFGARFLPGDIRLKGTLSQLSLQHADAIAFMTDDDLTNLEAGWAVAQTHPTLSVIAHVSDIAMNRAVHAAVEGDGSRRIRVFNRHRLAARHLYDEHLRKIFAGSEPLDTVVLAGFGRFGQTILEFLEQQAAQEIAKVVVVDRAAGARMRTFRDQVKTSVSCHVELIDGDVSDPEVWDTVAQKLSELAIPPVIVLGCDDDRVNLRGAMYLRPRWPGAQLFVRCQHESAFTEELSRQHEFTVLAIDQVLEQALKFEQHVWLLPTEPSPEAGQIA
jgi:Trk K+ transport system NAD-binding subunit